VVDSGGCNATITLIADIQPTRPGGGRFSRRQ